MVKRNNVLPGLFFALAFLVAAPRARAQADDPRDVLLGRITDIGGRPLSDAQVGVTSLATGKKRTFTTDDEGHYRIVFPENAKQYVILVKRVGFAPVQRTITRRSSGDEEIRTDVQFRGTPLALSVVEITGESDGAPPPPEATKPVSFDATVLNPLADILAMKDTLHLSAVQIVALGDLSDTLETKNATIYRNIKTLIEKSQQAGDVNQMAGSVAMMLEEASGNTRHAILEAEKVLRPEQWLILPQGLREPPESVAASAGSAKQ
ncbi:MAG TPA: carboxypeptidase-like regulatory domain-containing protein [Gemmatimonadaceae bacterium]